MAIYFGTSYGEVTVFGANGASTVDLTPDSFSFAPSEGQTAGAVVTSEAITVSGVTAGQNVPVSLVGGEWRYSADSGATWQAWGSASGSVQLGYQIQVRGTANNTAGASTSVTLTVGGVSATFLITTADAGSVSLTGVPTEFRRGSSYTFNIVATPEATLENTTVLLNGVPLPMVSLNAGAVTVATNDSTALMYSTSGYTLTVNVDGAGVATVNSRPFLPEAGHVHFTLQNPTNAADTVTHGMTSGGQPSSAISNDQIEIEFLDYPVSLTAAGVPIANVAGEDFVTYSFNARHIPSQGAGVGVPGAWATQTFTQSEDTYTRPDRLMFYSVNQLAPGATAISNVAVISGVAEGLSIPVSIVGGQWQYSSNSGATWSSWSSNTGTVQAGYWVRVRGTAPNAANASAFVDITVGGELAVFGVATALSVSYQPDPVMFDLAITGTAGALLTSSAVTLTGLTPNIDIPLSCSSGLAYQTSSDGGSTWSSWSGTEALGNVRNGWQLRVRANAPSGSPAQGARESYAVFIGTTPIVFHTLYYSSAPDLTPTAFPFTPAANQTPGTYVDSAVITVAGLGAGVSAPFYTNNCVWRKSTDGGNTFSPWHSHPDQFPNGTMFQLRVLSPQADQPAITAVANLGTHSELFLVSSQSLSDLVPDAFSFTAANNQPTASPAASNVVTVTGVTAGVDVPASVSNGEWRKSSDNGSTWTNYTTSAGIVRLGDFVQVQGTSSPSEGVTVNVTLTLGGVDGVFAITTLVTADTTPDVFSFSAAQGQDGGVSVTSTSITVAGVSAGADVPISATGGQWRKSSNGGGTWSAFTASSGTVALGDLVQAQGTSSSSAGGTVNVTVTIGGVAGVFAITTANDTSPNAFTFGTADNVPTGTVTTSSTAQITGVTAGVTVPASVVGGEWRYSSDAGATWSAWSSSPGNVRLNNLVQVRGTSSASPSATTSVTLTVGGVAGVFSVTTAAAGQDTTPNPFSFTSAENAEPNVAVQSNSVEVLAVTPGIDIPVTVLSGQWRKSTDGGATWSAWSTSAGVARLNNLLQVQGTSSSTPSAQVTVSLSVGGVTGTFTIATAVAADTTPDSFSFSDVADRPAGALETSNAITLTGVTAGVDVPVTVTGGEWRRSTNGGAAWGSWGSGAGIARLNDQLQVRGTASNASEGVVNVVLSVGGVTDTFTITTAAANDTTPSAFQFPAATNSALGALVESQAVQVLGVTSGVDVPASVTGGEWRKSTDGGVSWNAYGTSPGVVRLNDRVQVRGSASGTNSSTVTVSLTIGGVLGSFSITTVAADDLTPNQFNFPPVVGAAVATLVESAEVQITGVSVGVNVPVTCNGGEWRYSSDGGASWSAWSASAGNVQLNYRVQARVTSSELNGASTQVVLTVGGVSATFTVTTVVAAGTVLPPPGRVISVGVMQGFSIATGEWQTTGVQTKSQREGERLDYAFNLHNLLLRSGDAIATYTMEPAAGLTISNTSLAAAGTYVVFWVDGILPGTTYNVSCRVTTTHGRILKVTFRIVGLA